MKGSTTMRYVLFLLPAPIGGDEFDLLFAPFGGSALEETISRTSDDIPRWVDDGGYDEKIESNAPMAYGAGCPSGSISGGS